MLVAQKTIDRGVEQAIREALIEALSEYEIESIDIAAREDGYGDPAIFIDVHYAFNELPIVPARENVAGLKVWERLIAMGEARFPFINYLFKPGQGIARGDKVYRFD